MFVVHGRRRPMRRNVREFPGGPAAAARDTDVVRRRRLADSRVRTPDRTPPHSSRRSL